ncbi:MAG TPA: hypothetical protein VH951_12695 [Dehalococcoidia bacterium]
MLKLLALISATTVVLSAACSGGGDRVAVKWESSSHEAAVGDAGPAANDASTVSTVVYVSVNETVHDATVRLSEQDADRLLGMSITTVTPVRTEFDGATRLWRLGDLEPGKRYGLPISLSVSSTHREAAPDQLKLAVEVASPDLQTPVRSNVLALDLKR